MQNIFLQKKNIVIIIIQYISQKKKNLQKFNYPKMIRKGLIRTQGLYQLQSNTMFSQQT